MRKIARATRHRGTALEALWTKAAVRYPGHQVIALDAPGTLNPDSRNSRGTGHRLKDVGRGGLGLGLSRIPVSPTPRDHELHLGLKRAATAWKT